MNLSTFYRLTRATADGRQPVEKVVVARDGTRSFEKQGKIVAPDLATFKKTNPNIKVDGAPTEQNMALDLAGMTDEQLLAMGLQRAKNDDEPMQPDLAESGFFASPAAESAAIVAELTVDEIASIKGTGRRGLINSKDVRDYLDARDA